MKKLSLLVISIIFLTSCSITIPMQSNLSDQTMLLAKNKNIKANITLNSKVSNGYINFTSVSKNGSESVYSKHYMYASETAFKKLWTSYFSNKFNNFSEDEMEIQATLKELKLVNHLTTSMGMTFLTGNVKANVEAIAVIDIFIKYHGKKYQKQIEVNASEYNESQQMKSGNTYYTSNQSNPTQQQSKLLEHCLNKSIINFENLISSIIQSEKK